MTRLPLVAHDAPDNIIAWRTDGPVTVRRFLTEVGVLAARLHQGKHLLNLCSDRYRFSVGLAAAIISGKVSLLPSTYTPGVVRQIRDFAPDVFCLTDNPHCDVALPQLQYDLQSGDSSTSPSNSVATTAETFVMPQIDSEQCVAIVFTSGSTGTPQPHIKTWGALVRCVQAEALRLELPRDRPWAVIGTVPAQHMYGFESTVLMPWHTGNALCHVQPFYPADICQALAAVQSSRVLVSSPLHLRALVESEIIPPDITEIISATAPLSPELARRIETHCQAPVFEIYGSTETGQIASRRTAQSAQWRLFPGVRFVPEGDRLRACGGHVSPAVVMNDVIEPVDDEHFQLHGRLADMINIAGKRQSLANLDYLLNNIPGVRDGAFFMPDTPAGEQVTRLAACVVAPGMNASQLLRALREFVDPVFLPRPLVFVPALPRNSTGKLPRDALQALIFARTNVS